MSRPTSRHALCDWQRRQTSGQPHLDTRRQPSDGLLDLYIASPHRFRHWLKLALRLVTRRAKKDDQVDQRKGKSVRIIIGGKDNSLLVGDVVGESTTLFAVILHGALAI